MRVVKEGDKGKAICHKCGLITTTYNLRDVDYSDNRGVVSIPSQSVPKIKSDYKELKLIL